MVIASKREVIQNIVDGLRLDAQAPPTVIDNKISPVFIANPDKVVNIVETTTKGTTGTATILTASTVKETYITGISWTMQVDAANTGTVADVTFELADGTSKAVINSRKLASIAAVFDKVLMFDPPLKLIKGGTIKHTHTFAAGASAMSTTVLGYELEA